MPTLSVAPRFHNEEAAYAYVEARIWDGEPICPHCGGFERIRLMGGASTRRGTYKCYRCRKPFTVKIGTIFEASRVPMRLWLQAIFLIASSDRGFPTIQIHRTLGVTLRTAQLMSLRIYSAMRSTDAPLIAALNSSRQCEPRQFAVARRQRQAVYLSTKGQPGTTLKPKKDDLEQSARFEKAARELEATDGLSLADTQSALEEAMTRIATLRRDWLEGGEDLENPL